MSTLAAFLTSLALLLFFPIGLTVTCTLAVCVVVADGVKELTKALRDTWGLK